MNTRQQPVNSATTSDIKILDIRQTAKHKTQDVGTVAGVTARVGITEIKCWLQRDNDGDIVLKLPANTTLPIGLEAELELVAQEAFDLFLKENKQDMQDSGLTIKRLPASEGQEYVATKPDRIISAGRHKPASPSNAQTVKATTHPSEPPAEQTKNGRFTDATIVVTKVKTVAGSKKLVATCCVQIDDIKLLECAILSEFGEERVAMPVRRMGTRSIPAVELSRPLAADVKRAVLTAWHNSQLQTT